MPLHEPGLDELLERNRERLNFTLELDDVVDAPVLFVCVGTPPTYSGDADLTAVWTVVDQLPALEERALLVMKSTVPVGTGEKVRAALDARGLAHVGYVSNPEFLVRGQRRPRLHAAGPRRRRRLHRGRREDGRRALRPARDAPSSTPTSPRPR